jgi:HSP20 family protein
MRRYDMNLVRYEPTTLSLLNSFDRLFDGIFDDRAVNVPAVDVRETETGWNMEVDLPGLTEKDVEVKLDNNLLTVSSRKEEKQEEKKNGYLLRERRSSSFCRSFVLPDDVDREKIEAAFANGVLSLSFPKLPTAQPKTIDVKVK